MATKLYLREVASDYGTGNNDANLRGTASGWVTRALSTSISGSSVGSVAIATVAGPISGLEVPLDGTTIPLVWYSPPLDADVTISGSITWNLWAGESAMAANAAINGQLEVIDGATGTITLIDKTARTAELPTSATAQNFSETPAAGVACKRGDRLRVRVFADDSVDGNMGSGQTWSFAWNNPTPAASGDSYLTLTENLTFVSEPAGTTVYPTDTASAVSVTQSVAGLLSSFTGSDENPLSEGGNWANLNTSASGVAKRVSNAATGQTSTGWAYWTPANFGPHVEAHLTVTTVATVTISARIQGEGGAATWDGYLVERLSTVANIYRVTNAALTSIGSATGLATLATGDKVGIACHGSVIEAWIQPSGGAWSRVLAVSDTTYASAGKVGFSATTTSVIDDVYAGTAYDTFSPGATSGGAITEREAWTSRGGGVQTDVRNTAAGWTAPLQITDTAGGTVVDWFTKQLTAFTLGGAVRVNVRALESNALANAVIRCEVARVAADGTSPTVWGATTFGGAELTTSEAAQSFLVGGDDLAISDGQRLRIRFSIDDSQAAFASQAMAASHTVTLYYAGTSGGASGDTYLTFTQTLTESSAGTSVNATLATATGAASGATTSVKASVYAPSGYPAVESTTDTTLDSNTTTHTINLPATVNAGELLVLVGLMDQNTAPTVTWDSELTPFPNPGLEPDGQERNGVNIGILAAWKTADGSEGGTTWVNTISGTGERSLWRVFRISGWTGTPEATWFDGDTSTSPNPPAITPSWGSSANLYLAAAVSDGASNSFSGFPSGFSGTSLAGTDGALGTASLAETSSSKDPGTFTSALNEQNATVTIAIRGAAAGGPATVVGVANNASVTTGKAVTADVATATGAALGATTTVQTNAGVATATGAALNAAPNVGATASTATATGAALDATVTTATATTVNATPAAGTGLAYGLSASVQTNAATATGTGTAIAPAPAVKVNAGLATGTTAALGATVTAQATLSTATGTGAALAPSVAVAVNAGTVTGTAIAIGVTWTTYASSGVAAGSGAANPPSASVVVNAGVATGTGAALNATVSAAAQTNVNATPATASGTALGVSANVGATSGLATASGAALNVTATTQWTAGVATATGAATGVQASTTDTAPATTAQASGTAYNVTVSTQWALGVATATGTALGATAAVAKSVTATIATASGTATGASAAIAVNAALATATAAANNATFQSASNVSVQATPATASGTAAGVSAHVAPTAIIATAAGTGLGASDNVGATASTATATGTAINATVQTTAAGSATGTTATAIGTALNVTATIQTNASVATGTGAAQGASANVGATATTATATAAALGATVQVAKAVTATIATGTGVANRPAPSIAVNATTATATGMAQQATWNSASQVSVAAGLATGTGTALNASANESAITATGTGTANGVKATMGATSSLATGTGSALTPSVSIAVRAGIASGFSTAFGVAANLGVMATAATGTGTAYNPATSAVSGEEVQPSTATGLGTALGAGKAIATTARLATATGTAHDATAVGQALGAGISILATGTGEAWGATVNVGATAIGATGTGTAWAANPVGALLPRHISADISTVGFTAAVVAQRELAAAVTETRIYAAVSAPRTLAATVRVADGLTAHVED